MAQWRVVYRDGASELVDADDCRRKRGSLVLVDWLVVVMEPREVVVRRLAARDVERVERVAERRQAHAVGAPSGTQARSRDGGASAGRG